MAKVLGVSKSTVSRALQNDPRITKETIALVKAGAIKLGYEQDAVLSNLARQRWQRPVGDSKGSVLALLIGTPEKDLHESNAFKQIILSVKARAGELGYQTEVLAAPDSKADAIHSRACYHRGITGVILKSTGHRIEPWALDLQNFSVINLGLDLFPARVDTVRFDLFSSIWGCLDHCQTAGYRRIGLALLGQDLPQGELRRAGAYYAWHTGNDRQALPVLHFESDNWTTNLRLLRAWMEKQKPDVILGQCLFIMDMVKGLGLKVPGDVSFITLDLEPDISQQSTRGVTGIVRADARVAAAGVEWLDSLIRQGTKGEQLSPRSILITQDFREGATLPDKKKSRKTEGLPHRTIAITPPAHPQKS